MNILFIGDIVSEQGCEFVKKHLPAIKKLYGINFVIANGENSANGNGILPRTADFLFNIGVDVITSGNHIWQRREIYDYIEEMPQVIRPANYPKSSPGLGYYIADCLYLRLCIINLMGTAFLEPLESPFTTIDTLLSELKNQADCFIVDFHAEATSEKRALGFYLDGRVNGLVGTHTHVQTADAQILPNGTAYITDVGMTGGIHSVLGVRKEDAINKFITHMPQRFTHDNGDYMLCGVIINIDDSTKRTVSIESVQIK